MTILLRLTLTLDPLGDGQYRVGITPPAIADEDAQSGLSMFEAKTLDEVMADVTDRLIAYFRDCEGKAIPLTVAEDDLDLS
jgi:hypothetical protein